MSSLQSLLDVTMKAGTSCNSGAAGEALKQLRLQFSVTSVLSIFSPLLTQNTTIDAKEANIMTYVLVEICKDRSLKLVDTQADGSGGVLTLKELSEVLSVLAVRFRHYSSVEQTLDCIGKLLLSYFLSTGDAGSASSSSKQCVSRHADPMKPPVEAEAPITILTHLSRFEPIPKTFFCDIITKLQLQGCTASTRRSGYLLLEILLSEEFFPPWVLGTSNQRLAGLTVAPLSSHALLSPCDFVHLLLASVDGESDPELVLRSFQLVHRLIHFHDTAPFLDPTLIDELFESASSYFPVLFTPPPKCPVTKFQLKAALQSILCHNVFHEQCIPFLCSKISSPAGSVKLDCLDLFVSVLKDNNYTLQHLDPHLNDILVTLRNEVVKLSASQDATEGSGNTDIGSMIKKATQCLHHIARCFLLDEKKTADDGALATSAEVLLAALDPILSSAQSMLQADANSAPAYATMINSLASSSTALCSVLMVYLVPPLAIFIEDAHMMKQAEDETTSTRGSTARYNKRKFNCFCIFAALMAAMEKHCAEGRGPQLAKEIIGTLPPTTPRSEQSSTVPTIKTYYADNFRDLLGDIKFTLLRELEDCSASTSQSSAVMSAIHRVSIVQLAAETLATWVAVSNFCPAWLKTQSSSVELKECEDEGNEILWKLCDAAFSSSFDDETSTRIIHAIANLGLVDPQRVGKVLLGITNSSTKLCNLMKHKDNPRFLPLLERLSLIRSPNESICTFLLRFLVCDALSEHLMSRREAVCSFWAADASQIHHSTLESALNAPRLNALLELAERVAGLMVSEWVPATCSSSVVVNSTTPSNDEEPRRRCFSLCSELLECLSKWNVCFRTPVDSTLMVHVASIVPSAYFLVVALTKGAMIVSVEGGLGLVRRLLLKGSEGAVCVEGIARPGEVADAAWQCAILEPVFTRSTSTCFDQLVPSYFQKLFCHLLHLHKEMFVEVDEGWKGTERKSEETHRAENTTDKVRLCALFWAFPIRGITSLINSNAVELTKLTQQDGEGAALQGLLELGLPKYNKGVLPQWYYGIMSAISRGVLARVQQEEKFQQFQQHAMEDRSTPNEETDVALILFKRLLDDAQNMTSHHPGSVVYRALESVFASPPPAVTAVGWKTRMFRFAMMCIDEPNAPLECTLAKLQAISSLTKFAEHDAIKKCAPRLLSLSLKAIRNLGEAKNSEEAQKGTFSSSLLETESDLQAAMNASLSIFSVCEAALFDVSNLEGDAEELENFAVFFRALNIEGGETLQIQPKRKTLSSAFRDNRDPNFKFVNVLSGLCSICSTTKHPVDRFFNLEARRSAARILHCIAVRALDFEECAGIHGHRTKADEQNEEKTSHNIRSQLRGLREALFASMEPALDDPKRLVRQTLTKTKETWMKL